ncbi:MAG: Gx transporter family protein [Candidatus Cloacimonetes bacterium]|jgi:heptaprenyl diphosphate synthase|nr:Gx transporter family protein [Candidatus Cloacimonadota bacterium]HOA29029.1 Gx transporter family protein [Candidatus Cloacimonadota bacterium]HOH60021.1 Gx transporter family protein [Candidatus Cloacimonadota bacterium]HPI24980.1 Gx transporter family protein [Candidatus Cloacimonadota bacterium]
MKPDSILFLAFLTATASAVYIVENLIMSMLPIPFIRIGLSNVVLLYLVYHRRILSAFVVAIAKSVIGALATFSLLSPMLALSLVGGLAAVCLMSMGLFIRPRFSMFGISVLGAIGHNTAQLLLVRSWLIRNDGLFVLTPILILLGLISGIITAYLCLYIEDKIPSLRVTT